MTILVFSVLVFIFSFFSGVLGALTGLGGGIVIIPLLVLIFHINIHYAMGASLISVIATSSGTAAVNLRDGYTNLRVGMFFEVAAVIGAFVGALLIPFVSKNILYLLIGFILIISAMLTLKRKEDFAEERASHPWARWLKLEGTYPQEDQKKAYHVHNVPLAFSIMSISGLISGLLGIGGGVLKVLVMDQILHLPYKVATTTSNFMIGITAAVSAGIYFSYGYIQPAITFPVMIGVISGAFFGARILSRIKTRLLRIIFSVAICIIAIQMLHKGIAGA